MSKGNTNKLTIQLNEVQLDDASNQALEQLILNKVRSVVDGELQELVKEQLRKRLTDTNITYLLDRELKRMVSYGNVKDLAKESIDNAFKEKYGKDYLEKTSEFSADILTEKVYSIIEVTVKQILSRLLKG